MVRLLPLASFSFGTLAPLNFSDLIIHHVFSSLVKKRFNFRVSPRSGSRAWEFFSYSPPLIFFMRVPAPPRKETARRFPVCPDSIFPHPFFLILRERSSNPLPMFSPPLMLWRRAAAPPGFFPFSKPCPGSRPLLAPLQRRAPPVYFVPGPKKQISHSLTSPAALAPKPHPYFTLTVER